jgi:hypothetical protein
MIILKCILKDLDQNEALCRDVVITVMNLRVVWKAGNFLTN